MAEDRPMLVRVGISAWSVVGIVAVLAICVSVLAAVSSVVLPMLFAALLAVLFLPLARTLERRGLRAPVAAIIVVLGLVAVCVGVLVVAIYGIASQFDEVVAAVEAGLEKLTISSGAIADVGETTEDLKPAFTSGFIRAGLAGISALGGFAVGSLLGALIMYYLLKDGEDLRRQLIGMVPAKYQSELADFMTESAFVIRRYWLGRTIVSAIVAAVVGIAALLLGLPTVASLVVVTFIGGYVPYIGAFLGGLLAVVIALGSSGTTAAIIMLAVTLTANLVIENFVEPAVTGRTLSVHPLVVLLVTTLGGILGGLVGLIVAVPLTVIAAKGLARLRRIHDVDASDVREAFRRRTAAVADGNPDSVD